MAISVNWGTKVITVPQSYCTSLGGGIYSFDVNQFRLDLKDLEDSEEGMPFPDTHSHNTEVTLSGVNYARTLEIINGYTVTFEATGTPWTAKCIGANHNIADVKNVNHVSLIISNSAGLQTVATGSGPSAADIAAAVLAAAQATPIHGDVRKINNVPVIGTGTSGDLWRA